MEQGLGTGARLDADRRVIGLATDELSSAVAS